MKKLIASALAFSPMLALAQTNQPNLSYIENLVKGVARIVNIAMPLVVGLALLAFFWGIVKMVWGGEKGREEGKPLMIWGVVALFVMVSIWGLIRFLGSVTGVDTNGGTLPVPTVNLKM